LGTIFKLLFQGIFLFLILYVIGYFPALTVAATAVIIVFLFLVFGKE